MIISSVVVLAVTTTVAAELFSLAVTSITIIIAITIINTNEVFCELSKYSEGMETARC